MQIRPECLEDIDAVRTLTSDAFRPMPYSSHTEAAIVDALRAAGVVTISLVAIEDNIVVGHVAFSPVTINAEDNGWYGLGPVSVEPGRQRRGIGKMLILDGLERLRGMGARGCVVLGDPNYYRRFGFASDPQLHYGDVPPEHFQRLAFGDVEPKGEVKFHAGFDAK